MKMLESSVIRYCLYGSCAIISSEILYHSYFWLKKKLNEYSSSEKVHEVIWTNELTQCCVSKPSSYNGKCNSRGTSPSTKMPSPSRIVKLTALFKSNKKCENPFCGARNVARLTDLIDSANYSIDLAMYTFTSFDLSQAFIRALKRGVSIRVITDHEMAFSSGSQIIPLTKSGVPIRCNSNTSFMHHKFCLLDCPRRVNEILMKHSMSADKSQIKSILLTGSLNWTYQGLSGNWENILITNEMQYVKKYSEEFERMWRVFDVDLKNK